MPSTNHEEQFNEAVSYIKDLEEQKNGAFHKIVPKNTLITLHGLHKQSTIGDCNCRKPFIFGRRKWDSWNSLRGLSSSDAMLQYVTHVLQIRVSIEKEKTTS